eukprot:8433014-Pyramimonas_sp.AAC.1
MAQMVRDFASSATSRRHRSFSAATSGSRGYGELRRGMRQRRVLASSLPPELGEQARTSEP